MGPINVLNLLILTTIVTVANFHTHPLRSSNSPPSDADLDNNWRRQIPGLVISREGIFSYVTVLPEREDRRKPIQYPGNETEGGRFSPRREPTPGWSLQNAPNQVDGGE